VDAYERLRSDVNGARCGGEFRGLGIFLREGMAAWMRAVATVSAAATSEAVMARASEPLAGVEREVINVLTAMALSSVREVGA